MDIQMNDEQWRSLSGEDQRRIEQILRGFFKEARVVADAEVPRSDAQLPADAAERGFCEIGCNLAEVGAKAACNAIGNPVLREACLSAATAAGELCRSKC